MAMVGLVETGWMWWMVCMKDEDMGPGRMSGDTGALQECDVIH